MAVPVFTAALALLVQTAAPPFAPPGVRWVALPAGPTVRTEYDPASIRRHGDRATVTIRSAPLDNPAGHRTVGVMVIDCPGHGVGLQTFHTYAPDGTYLETHTRPLEGIVLEPGGGGGTDELHDAVCGAQ